MIKEIYVHAFIDGKLSNPKMIYHIHDNPQYTVIFWERLKKECRVIRGDNVHVYSHKDSDASEGDMLQAVLPFLKADYPHLLKDEGGKNE